MSDVPDLLAIGSSGKLSAPQDPGDPAIWTVLGEAGADPEGQRAVASTIVNRATKAGVHPHDVVLDPDNGYEAWQAHADELKKRYPVGSDAYEAAKALVTPILGGEQAAPYGFDSFYSPEAQKALGRSAPAFDDGSGVNVGGNLFFADKYAPRAAPDLLSIAGRKALPAPAADETGASPPATTSFEDGKLVFGDTKEPVPAPQASTYATLAKGHAIDPNAAPGSPGLPYLQRRAEDTFSPGSFYIDTAGHLAKVPDPDHPDTAGVGTGLGQGVADVPNSLFKLAPGHEDSELASRLEANRLLYDAEHHGNPAAAAGRFAGQLASTIPVMGAAGKALEVGGNALVRAAPEIAPAFDFLGGNAGGGLIARTGSKAAQGALQGAAYAGLTSGADSSRSPGEQMVHGAEFGAVAGPAASAIGPAAGAAYNKLFGGSVTPKVAELAQTAMEKYSIPLRRSQVLGVGDRGMAIADSERLSKAGTGYAGNAAAQRQAFTRAVAKTFGADADSLTPEVMQGAKSRLGNEFDRIARATTIENTNGLIGGLHDTLAEATQVLPEGDVAPLAKQVESITSAIKDGVMSGESYQALVRKGSPLDRATESANPNVRHYAQRLRDNLDDALQTAASPEDTAALKMARWQYKNLMTVKNLAAKANVEGEISPALLAGAVNSSFKNRGFTGAGDLGELSTIAQTFLKEPPNSGTPGRLRNMLLGGASLADLGLAAHDPATAIKLAAAGVGMAGLNYGRNAAIGAYNRSPGVVNRLIAGADAAQPRDLSTVNLNFRPLNDNAGILGAAAGNHLIYGDPSPARSAR